MKNTDYDFKSIIDRKNTNSAKWDYFNDDLPMWVADMDFKVAPQIHEAILKRANHPVYGYSIVPDSLFQSYIKWWSDNYNLVMNREDMLYATGVVPSIASMIRCFTDIGDNILLQSPVYHAFYFIINDNNRNALESELIFENSEYKIDFDDLDKKLADTKLMFLCNPHNPIGKIWSKSDLENIGKLCKKHDVILIADEIHCDLTDPDKVYNPFMLASTYEKTILCLSPSKSFNIAGFQSSIVYCKNKELLSEIQTQLHIDNSDSANVFAVSVVEAAYNESAEWLLALKNILFENKKTVEDFLLSELSQIKLIKGDATYLLWLDCRELKMSSDDIVEHLRTNQGLFLSSGNDFGRGGDGFLRLNIACPEKLLIKGLNKLKEGVLEIVNGQ